jgi:hypothetical protein
MEKEMTYHRWTQQELHILMTAAVKYEQNWKKIQAFLLPHLNIVTMKNKYQ